MIQGPIPAAENDPFAIGSDTILWSWSADRIPQTPISIGSSDREIMKPNSYCQLNHDKNHSLENLELKLRGRDSMKNVRLIMTSQLMGGVAT